MRGKTALIFVFSALVAGATAAAAEPQKGAYFCPPGARFCPAPGCDNEDFLNTYFAMDAKTGEVVPVTSIDSLAVDNTHLDSGEVVLLAAPNGNYENRYVPPTQVNLTRDPVTPHSEVANQMVQRSRETLANNDKVPWWKGGMWRNRRDDDNDNGGSRSSGSSGSGSARRNTSDSYDDGYDDYDDYNDRASTPPTRSLGKAPRMVDEDDMWDDEEYDGYNPDGSFGRPAGGNQQQAQTRRAAPRDDELSASPRGSGTVADEGFNAQAPRSFGGDAGFGPAPNQVSPPAPVYSTGSYDAGSYATDTYTTGATYAGDVYTPPPMVGGYSSNPYDDVPVVVENQGRIVTQTFIGNLSDSHAPGYPAASYGTTTHSDPYSTPGTTTYYDTSPFAASPAATTYGSTYDAPAAPYDSGYSAGMGSVGGISGIGGMNAGPTASSWAGDDAFTSPPPAPTSYQGTPSIDAQGSPQFENAVRLVKDNRFSEAKNILVSETSRNPSNAAAWRWLADCHYNLLELDEAINSYQRAMERDPNDYYALRGQGFSYLHRGHEYWRRMQDEVGRGEKETAAATFAQAHDNYKKSLELLGLCLRRAPNDGEAIYGEAMAAEGASRKLYSNAISYLKLGPSQRERAELFAENCLTVINKGIERSNERAKQNPGDAGPRALLGGLYLRKAILYNQLGKTDLALIELRNSRDVQKSILDEIDKNNATAQKNIKECEAYWEAWGGNRQ